MIKARSHIHAVAMAQYAADMAKDSTIVWQYKSMSIADDWFDLQNSPGWEVDLIYRRKPIVQSTITIQVPISVGFVNFLMRVEIDPDDNYKVVKAEIAK